MPRSLTANVVANSAGAVVNALSGLVTAAYLLRQLGVNEFGTWALVVSTTSLLWLLDLGMTVAVGRLIAAQRANDNVAEISRILTTAVAVLGACCLAIVLVSWFMPWAFNAFFQMPPEKAPDVARAVWLMGLASAIHFVAAPYTCFLWGYERFDLMNSVEIPSMLLRLAMLFVFVGAGSAIWVIAACTLFTGCLAAVGYMVTSFVLERRLSLRPGLFKIRIAAQIIRTGLEFAVMNGTRSLVLQLPPIIIGYTLGTGSVAIFSIARQLSTNCNSFVSAATEAVAARSVQLFQVDAEVDQRRLLLMGGRYNAALSCFLTFGLLLMGDSFIHLWQGGRAPGAYEQLTILLAGEFFALSQWTTFWVIMGMRMQRALTLFSAGEGLTILAASALLVGFWGLAGIAVAAAVAAALWRGVAPLFYGFRLLNVPVREYASQVVLPNLIVSLPAVMIGYAIDHWLQPRDWTTLILAAIFYAAAFAALLYPAMRGEPQMMAPASEN
ncbi:oligosaccharide flippase family protein [Mesorhizobium sp. BAC0120]|uniref:lipopolysaccharide biosynthesis protein n=1 Tax=Mesorhizobium sp. BAC0120 TaxID=3090670 RepID=UPI00298C73DF|nr:oligosaccharide flippase family protein [Mesorhizobium sp. BAC0120]MDW6023082.1 oligosaccharide flippase family protein [Mesorhizobium sp. BAC0120]